MSSTATDRRLGLVAGCKLAERIIASLRPGCERIEVAGSIRRRCATVGDIELVIIPKLATNLFGDALPGESLLDVDLTLLLDRGRLTPGRCDGPRHKNFVLGASGVSLDLFIVTRETWGVQLAIRTGPAAFSKSMVTERRRGGRLDDGLVVHDGRVWHGADYRGPFFHSTSPPLDTPEERDFLDLAGGWVNPEDRR